MFRPWHSHVYMQEADGGGTGGGGASGAAGGEGQAGAQQGQQGQQGAQGQQGEAGFDGNALFKKGNAHAEKVNAEWMQKVFGTTDRAEVEKAMAAVKKPKGEEIPHSVVEKMREMSTQIETLQGQISDRDRNQALTEGILSADLNFHNRQDVLDLIRLRYDFKVIDGKMIAHTKNGDPVILNNKFAEVKDVLTSWSKDAQYAYLFAKGQRTGMPDTNGNGGSGSSKLKPGELTDSAFVQALKDSGEYYKAMTDQPFDREKVKHFMGLLGNGKNLTAVKVG